MKELKEGMLLCKREYACYGGTYNWRFRKIKKITPKGRIRLDDDTLIDCLGYYKVFDEEMEKLYTQDMLIENVKTMLLYLSDNRSKLLEEMSIEDVQKLGESLDSFNFGSIDSWGRTSDKERYEKCNKDFNKFNEELKSIK